MPLDQNYTLYGAPPEPKQVDQDKLAMLKGHFNKPFTNGRDSSMLLMIKTNSELAVESDSSLDSDEHGEFYGNLDQSSYPDDFSPRKMHDWR